MKKDNGKTKRNPMYDAVLGLVVGDALGLPVEFCTREERDAEPVDKMLGYGTFNKPEGTWSDDSSLTLATLDAINKSAKSEIDLRRIAENFVRWFFYSEFTPDGESFDIGNGTAAAIISYVESGDIRSCGCSDVTSNGNGSLMRIVPVCIYCASRELNHNLPRDEAIDMVHKVSGLTHNHLRSKIGCGLYYFIVFELLASQDENSSIENLIHSALAKGFLYYSDQMDKIAELTYYARTKDTLEVFKKLEREQIKSTGYVVDTFEAAIWCLINSKGYSEAVLKAVNLGGDTDTIGACTGGIAGLYYGTDSIPDEWIKVIKRRDYIADLCRIFAERYFA